MENRIKDFILEQKNLTFCTSENNQPYCANCFYVFLSEDKLLVFKSDSVTKHISQAIINNKVAGTIVPDLDKTGTVKGIQFTGDFFSPEGEMLEKTKKAYYKKFPFGRAVPGDIWVVKIMSIKMTDNTLGFGKKLYWERQKS